MIQYNSRRLDLGCESGTPGWIGMGLGMYIRELLMVLGAYALGSFSTGYYLVRFRTGL